MCTFGDDCLLENMIKEKLVTDIAQEEVVGIEFKSVEVADVFYRKYTLYMGLGVRRDKKRYDNT